MVRFKDWKIQTKLVVTMLALVLAPMVMVSSLALSSYTKSLQKNTEEHLEQIVMDLFAMCRILIEASDERMANNLTAASRLLADLGPVRLSSQQVEINGQSLPVMMAGDTELSLNSEPAERVRRLIGESVQIYQFGPGGSLYSIAASYRHDHTEDLQRPAVPVGHPAVAAIAKGQNYYFREADPTTYYTRIYSPIKDRGGKVVGALAVGGRAEPTTALARAVGQIKVGHTGYAYTMDTNGRLMIHPAKPGQNIIESRDTSGHFYIREMTDKAETLEPGQMATIRYPWVNPELGETEPRMKITKYTYFPEWGWIIAAGSYETEIFAGTRTTRRNLIVIFIFTVIAVVILTMGIARRLTRPVRRMSMAAKRMADGDLSTRVYLDQEDEMGEMGQAFNHMANQIEQYTENLQGLVAEKTKELRRTKDYYESIVESSADMIITTNKQGKVTFANRATARALGYRASSMIGKHVSMFYPKGFQKAQEIMDMLREHGGSFSNYEMPLIGRNGKTIPILTSAALLRDEDGRVMGTVGVFTDITERKKLEAELRRTQASLVQAGKMRAMGDLVSGVAHELNNPLMASQSLVHVIKLKMEPEDPNHRRIDIIGQCNDRMATIINHLREFSRADEPQFDKIDLNLPIRNTLMITGQQLMNHNVTLEKELTQELPPIMGNVNQLEQVFLNLVANAKDAMEGQPGEKKLTIRTFAERTAEKTWVKATVTDNGTGIPEEVMEKIFNPFFSTKEQGKGTGLGLAITYGIIEDHKGSVDVKTRVGQGTTFTISIPAAEGSDEQS